MVKEILQSIEGIEVYPIISLALFLLSFTFALLATWRMSRAEVEYAGRLPLEDSGPGLPPDAPASANTESVETGN